MNRPYWAYDETIETAIVVHVYRDMGDLWVEIAATSLSKAYTIMDVTDIDFLAEGGTDLSASSTRAKKKACDISRRAFITN